MNYQSKKCELLVKTSKIVVFDESHHASCKTIFKLAQATATDTILIGLSATPFREDGETMRLEAALGPVTFTILRRDLIDKGYLSDAVVKYVDVFYDPEEDLTYVDEYKRYIVENDDRNLEISDIAEEEAVSGKKVLILVTHIEHGERLMDLISGAVFFNGGVKDRTVNLETHNIIIASSVFNEGVDLPALDVLIIAGAGKSEIQLTQKIGRVLRMSKNKDRAIIYDFVDKGKYLSVHYRKRRKLLSEEFEIEQI
jgi:superfamily II DNA or RNA helicase